MPKGLIYDIKRFALHDGPGIRSTVFFKGCPLNCHWCHNPESRIAYPEEVESCRRLGDKTFFQHQITGYEIDDDELMETLMRDRAFMEESGGGVSFSGGEPLMQAGFLEEMLVRLTSRGIHTAVDTSGYCDPLVFERIAPKADLFLFDFKHPDRDKHMQYTGVFNDLIMRNLSFLHEQTIKTIIRIPVIPDINDGFYAEETAGILQERFPGFREIHLLPYHSTADHKYRQYTIDNPMKGVDSLYPADIQNEVKIFERRGFSTTIGG